MMQDALFLHGVAVTLPIAGDLRPVSAVGLTAVASSAHRLETDTLAGAEAALRWHDRVLTRLAETTDVVPFRFGTVVSDVEAARRLLEDRAVAFRDALTRIAGRREFIARLTRSPQGHRDLAAEDEPAITGRVYLQRRAAGRSRVRRERDAETAIADELKRALGALGPVRPTGQRKSDTCASFACLVARTAEKTIVDTLAGLGERAGRTGLALRLIGPTAAYHFSGEDQ
ncbi:MAG: GvpL/GvpF family gas vesicle protein [Paracoccaceae bacterium]